MRLKKDQISNIFWSIVAGIILVSSVDASIGSFESPGSGMVPFLASCLMLIFSLSGLILATRKNTGDKEAFLFFFQEINWKNLITTLLALFAFPVLLGVLGFDLTVFAFTLFLSKVIEPRRWSVALVFALSTTLASHLLFVYWLKFFAEKGIFGI